MRFKQLLVPALLAVVAIFSSCLNTEDPTAQYAEWKYQNEAKFNTYKDSASFHYDTIPVNRGGYGYYSRINTVGDASKGTPAYTDTVVVHYRGKLINGVIFDQSYKGTAPDFESYEDPRSFKVSGVVKGWQEVLQQMHPGENRTVVLPWELGYGANGQSSILPYSVLIFDIQLLSYGTPKQ